MVSYTGREIIDTTEVGLRLLGVGAVVGLTVMGAVVVTLDIRWSSVVVVVTLVIALVGLYLVVWSSVIRLLDMMSVVRRDVVVDRE